MLGAEQCDDNNTVNGDGCSASCALEAGYDCRNNGLCCAPLLAAYDTVQGSEFAVSYQHPSLFNVTPITTALLNASGTLAPGVAVPNAVLYTSTFNVSSLDPFTANRQNHHFKIGMRGYVNLTIYSVVVNTKPGDSGLEDGFQMAYNRSYFYPAFTYSGYTYPAKWGSEALFIQGSSPVANAPAGALTTVRFQGPSINSMFVPDPSVNTQSKLVELNFITFTIPGPSNGRYYQSIRVHGRPTNELPSYMVPC